MPLPKAPVYRREDPYSRYVIARAIAEPGIYTKPHDIAMLVQRALHEAGYKIVSMTEKDGKSYGRDHEKGVK